ncbi:MAG TPA: translocation/assembly module TamB domain-containing protein, partial [Rubrivivax sp.]|nr:translocation/assembly module TamB domain-containing protein [Rubrivivax sp.]
QPPPAPQQQQRAVLTADLNGTPLTGPARTPLRLQAEGEAVWTAKGNVQAQLKRLVATQGRSTANVEGTLRRSDTAAPWAAAGQVGLAEFDPRPWLPGPGDSPLRRAEGRVNAKAVFDVTLTAAAAPGGAPGPAGGATPGATPGASSPSLVSAVRGSADLTLAPSQLAGVTLQGQAQLRAPAGGTRIEANAQLDAAGNRLNARWRSDGDIGGPASAAANVDAPALQRMAPLLQAVGFRGAAPGGSLRADASADIRWPDLTTTGTLRADGLSWQGIRVQSADGRWRIGSQPGAPTELDLRVVRLTLPGSTQLRQVNTLEAQLTGTAAQHRLQLGADVAAAPPAWADAVQGTAVPAKSPVPTAGGPRTRIALQAAGGLQHDGQTLAGWRGQLLALDVARPESTQPLLRTRAAVPLVWTAARGNQGMGVQAEPGSAEVLGSNLRWSRIRWQAGASSGNNPAAPMQLDVDAAIDAVQVAPLLARLQPQLGWAGDLRVSARAVAATAPALRAEFTVQRASGDLQLQQAGGTRRTLGLNAMTVTARADGNNWKASGRVSAASVGNATIELNTRAAPGGLWPDANSPLQGTAQFAIADLGIYGPWLPVGWRIGGALDLNARLSGRIGAPQYLGTVRGRGLTLAHFLEGIAVQDGELQATLDGERGRIDRFTARGGQGTLRATGEARFGAAPTAQLTLVAERFRALGRVDRQVDLSGSGNVRLEATRIALAGRFTVDEGLVDLGRGEAPELSKDVRVVDGPTPGRPPPKPAAPGTARTKPQRAVEMDVRV